MADDVDVVAFLKARLDEAEQAAKHGPFLVPGPDAVFTRERLLRDVEAKRDIVAQYTDAAGADTATRRALLAVLDTLAEVWSDHPDYEKA